MLQKVCSADSDQTASEDHCLLKHYCPTRYYRKFLKLATCHGQTKMSTLKGYCTVFQHALKSLEITGIVLS